MQTLTQEDIQKIVDFVDTHEIAQGLGTNERPCSIAAINLAITNRLSGDIPACMSRVIGRWIIRVQDAMPHDLRNSSEWKTLLPQAAGTGRAHEPARAAIILDWLWARVLPQIQSAADARGFGATWREMCARRTVESAIKARVAADADADADAGTYAYSAAYAAAAAGAYAYSAAAAGAYAYSAAYAAATAAAAYYYADAADADAAYYAAAYAAAAAADAAYSAADAAAADAAAADAADAAYSDAYSDAQAKFWKDVNPAGLLAKLIAVSA